MMFLYCHPLAGQMHSSQVVSYIKLRNETDGLVLSAPGSRYSQKYEDNANSNFVLTFLFVCPVQLFFLFLTFWRTFNFTSRSIIHRKCYNCMVDIRSI